MSRQLEMVNALTAAATGANVALDPRFVTRQRNHFVMQDLEAVKIDRKRLMLYPTLGAEASDAERTHSFNIARAALKTERRITIEDGLILAASRLNCSTQMSSALAEVVSELDEAMFDPANMVVAHYLTRAGVVIAAGHAMIPGNPGAVPPVIAALRPVQDGAAAACRPEIGFVTVRTTITQRAHKLQF